KYTVYSNTIKLLQTHFISITANQIYTKNEIKQVFTESNYAIDPHTAVASFVTRKYEESTADHCPTVTVSTASPYKFPQTVLAACGIDNATGDLDHVQELVDLIKLLLPKTVAKLFEDKQLHDTVIEPDEMEKYVKQLLISTYFYWSNITNTLQKLNFKDTSCIVSFFCSKYIFNSL